MDLVKRLETYRLEYKITQQSLATRLGVSFVTVNRWLNNKTRPNKIQQYHIEKFLVERLGSLTPTTSQKAVVWPPIAKAMRRSESSLNKSRRKKVDI